jgi:hypothetical protein
MDYGRDRATIVRFGLHTGRNSIRKAVPDKIGMGHGGAQSKTQRVMAGARQPRVLCLQFSCYVSKFRVLLSAPQSRASSYGVRGEGEG